MNNISVATILHSNSGCALQKTKSALCGSNEGQLGLPGTMMEFGSMEKLLERSKSRGKNEGEGSRDDVIDGMLVSQFGEGIKHIVSMDVSK